MNPVEPTCGELVELEEAIVARMTGGEAVVAALLANGVRLAFGMPGMHNLAIYDALLDRPALRHILVRNEQGASLMANAVARTTGQPGVCLVTTGPAACNALVGVADAARDSVPMLVVASQIRSDLIGQGKGAFHEMADQKGMYEAAGAWATRVNRVEQIPAAINAAWVAMMHGRPRPAYVELPEDVLFATGEVSVTAAAQPPYRPATRVQLDEMRASLLGAQRPLVYVGSGMVRAGAGAELVELIERLALPVISTIHGKGVVPDDHPLCAGVMPLADPAWRTYLAKADLLLALGTGFSEASTAFWQLDYPARVIHVDVDGAQIGRNVPATLGVVGDVRAVLVELNAALTCPHLPSLALAGSARGRAVPGGGQCQGADVAPRSPSAWTQSLLGLRALMTEAVRDAPGMGIVRALRACLPRDAMMVGDAQGWAGWSIYHFPTYGAGQLIYPIHFGTLGYAVPGAIGVQAMFPERRVVAVCGDGGFMFCANELATAAQHGLNVIVVVVNDGCLRQIRTRQERRYGPGRACAADLQNPDFAAYARACRCWGRQVNALEAFEPALVEALEAGRPALLEVTFPVPWSPHDYGIRAVDW